MKVMQLSLDFAAPMSEGAKVVSMPAAADRQLTPGNHVSSMSWNSVSDLDEVAMRQGLSDLFIDADLAWCRKCPMAEICDKITCHWDEDEDNFML